MPSGLVTPRRPVHLAALALLAAVASGAGCSAPDVPKPQPEGDRGKAPAGRDWPMFGGSPQRNMVNLAEKGMPTTWDVEKKSKNVKWVAETGSRGYGSPVVAGGKVFVATNNEQPRDPKVKGPKAVLMCYREADGKFLWQAAHDMPPVDAAEGLNDGLCSTPMVAGDRVYYVTPGCEVVCAGVADGKPVWRYDMVKQLKV